MTFCKVEKLPSPKDQFQYVGELVEVSLNWTVRGATPEVGIALKLETGVKTAEETEISPVWESVVLPALLPAVRLTV